jgi:hypothetical protein
VKVPKYVINAMEKSVYYANKEDTQREIVMDWLFKNKINVEENNEIDDVFGMWNNTTDSYDYTFLLEYLQRLNK